MNRAIAAGLLLIGCLERAEAFERPANTLRELSQAFTHCARLRIQPTGSEITILFSLKRDGSLLGKPRITYSKLKGDSDDQREFVGSALSALSTCFPLNIFDALGGAIAGRPLSIRFIGRPVPSAI
ncbi:hypothetical protein SAMN05444161_5367 [Rhizobiales bacterium GAS191]|nr:hypothetical protein SAMN05444161_5367 [Rhizobiales bacterium GAS191]